MIADDGPGLPPEIAESLFGGDFGSSRAGIGLLIVERVVSGHGWEANVEVRDGTQFVFSGVGEVKEKPRIQRWLLCD